MMRRIIVSGTVSLLLLGANSCMTLGGGMMGGGMTHAGSGGARDTSARAERVVKETTVGNISVVVDYPAASVGKEITYIVHVSDAASKRPIDDAHIRTLIRNAPASHATDQPVDHAGDLDTNTQSPGVRRLDTPGVYAFNHRLHRPGAHEIAMMVFMMRTGRNLSAPKTCTPPSAVTAIGGVGDCKSAERSWLAIVATDGKSRRPVRVPERRDPVVATPTPVGE